MISVNGSSQRDMIYSGQKQYVAKKNSFSTLLQETLKTQKNQKDSIQINKNLDMSALAKKYDVHNLDEAKRKELLTQLQQMGEIDDTFHYGFVLLPVTLEELKANPQCMVEFVPKETETVHTDMKDMLAFSKQVADSQMALYQKLAREGNVIPKLKEEAQQYRKLAEILEKLEELRN